jgi:hypothetical protein
MNKHFSDQPIVFRPPTDATRPDPVGGTEPLTGAVGTKTDTFDRSKFVLKEQVEPPQGSGTRRIGCPSCGSTSYSALALQSDEFCRVPNRKCASCGKVYTASILGWRQRLNIAAGLILGLSLIVGGIWGMSVFPNMGAKGLCLCLMGGGVLVAVARITGGAALTKKGNIK